MTILAEVIATILLVLENWDDKRDLAKVLLKGLLKLIQEPRDNLEAMRGLAEGIARARANAVQEYIRGSRKVR